VSIAAWRVAASGLRRAKIFGDGKTGVPTPLRCFLEVLILKDFKSLFPEVLILLDFKSFEPEVLILVDFKFMGMNEMRDFQHFWTFSEFVIRRGAEGDGGLGRDALFAAHVSV
jgi:hypothetical protein